MIPCPRALGPLGNPALDDRGWTFFICSGVCNGVVITVLSGVDDGYGRLREGGSLEELNWNGLGSVVYLHTNQKWRELSLAYLLRN